MKPAGGACIQHQIYRKLFYICDVRVFLFYFSLPNKPLLLTYFHLKKKIDPDIYFSSGELVRSNFEGTTLNLRIKTLRGKFSHSEIIFSFSIF